MRITIAAVGRLKDTERALVDRYLKRLTAAKSVGFGPIDEHETSESRRSTAAERQAEEAARLIKSAGDADVIVALDEQGALRGRQGRRPPHGIQSVSPRLHAFPVQLVRTRRRLIFRLLAWNPWQAVFLRGFDHLGAPLRL